MNQVVLAFWYGDIIGGKRGLMEMRSFSNRVHCAILLAFSWREEKDGSYGIGALISYAKTLRSHAWRRQQKKKNQFFVPSSTISSNTSSTMCMISILIPYHPPLWFLLLSTRSQRENQCTNANSPFLTPSHIIPHLLIDTITTPINL